jgi:hypothetical protein
MDQSDLALLTPAKFTPKSTQAETLDESTLLSANATRQIVLSEGRTASATGASPAVASLCQLAGMPGVVFTKVSFHANNDRKIGSQTVYQRTV